MLLFHLILRASFSINHYGTAYATGKQLERDTGVSWWGLDDIEKTFYKNGKLIGRRGENGHPHTGKFPCSMASPGLTVD